VGYAELTLVTRQAASTTKAFFTFFMAAGLLYLCISVVSTLIFGRIEAWARRGQVRQEGR
jgi:polar amino acid transport system permease protein